MRRLLCRAGARARALSRRCRASSTTTSPGPRPNGYQSLHTVVRGDDGAAGRDADPHPRDARACRARRGGALGLQGGRRERLCRRQRRRRLRRARGRGAQGGAAPAAGLGARLRRASAAHAGAARRSTTASTSSRRRPRWSSCRRAPRRSTSPTALHTDLGHRCRGARVDGAMVPLNTPLANGQTVEIIAAKEGGPSLRLAQRRTRLPAEPALARQGARLVQRAGAGTRPSRAAASRWKSCCSAKGKTALKLDDLAAQLGFKQRRRAVRSGRQGRVLAAQHRDAAAPGRAAADARRADRAAAPRAPATARQGRRAGGRRRVAADHAGALLPAGAARRRSAATSRAARASPSTARDCSNLRQHGGARARARDRGRLGRAERPTARRCTRST